MYHFIKRSGIRESVWDMLKCLGVSTALKVGKEPLRQIYRIRQLCVSVFVIPHNSHPGSNPSYAEEWARAK